MGSTAARAMGIAAIILAGTFLAPAAATADDGTYAPITPREPGLEGSVVSATCDGAGAEIAYIVQVVGADKPVNEATLRLVGEAPGTHEVVLDLPGRAAAGHALRGRIPWPGDSDGGAEGGELMWTRGAIRAQLQVDDLRLAVPLEYPAESCAERSVPGALAATGAEVPVVAAVAGVAALGAGAIAIGAARRRRGDVRRSSNPR